MKNLEHVFFSINHVLHFFPTNFAQKFKKSKFFFSYFLSNETHKISQIYKHKDIPTDLQNTKTFNNYSVIPFQKKITLSFFHIPITNTKTWFKIPSTIPKSLHTLIQIYRPKQTQMVKTQSNRLDWR